MNRFLVWPLFMIIASGCDNKVGLFGDPEDWKRKEEADRAYAAQLESLSQEIKSMQGSGDCNSDSDCRVMGLGAVTCGGYRKYLVFSVRDANEALLQGKIAEFNRVSEKATDSSLKAAQDCGKPGAKVECADRKCQGKF